MGREAQTRNLEIPGSRFARPGMTFSIRIEDSDAGTVSTYVSVPRPALLAAPPYAPLPVPARLAGIPPPAPAGFKPELS
jgi:hypothetical protein